MSSTAILLMAFSPLILAAAAYLLAEFCEWLDRVIQELLP